MAKIKSKRTLKNSVVRSMEELGKYKKEYEIIIDIFVDLLDQYQHLYNEFEASSYKITADYTNKAGATNERKVPLVTALESLRKDIMNYSDRLCLNPKALNETKNKKPASSSPFSSLMKNL
ncbi:P27 family phage terminase small subunit [Enterococcus sp. BWR-S5]|uniref:P27 family phage terminase small subunit n=1 Tax=Enterococcus sp. BWR-S5 TaxID=2787714 RepID=UPI0019208EA6|nr:P27 family phage terminase small subunit [Enterococcus sp. BWR-S5]MBL1226596.1 P27 family phage terminase small subunit [Enterococcus sp. BWR-S5]